MYVLDRNREKSRALVVPRLLARTLLTSALILAIADPAAADDEPPLTELIDRCDGCHGTDGVSKNWHTPNLAGQHYQYLVEQLRLFRAEGSDGHSRRHATMEYHAGQLSETDVERLARHFASQTCEVEPAVAPLPDDNRCVACHGVNGISEDPSVPNLAGQRLDYMVRQLKLFQRSAGVGSAREMHASNNRTERHSERMEAEERGLTSEVYFTLHLYATRRCR